MKRFLLLAAVALLAGCGSMVVYPPSATASVICEGDRCDVLWRRAQTWLATNSQYRLQVVSDVVLQTYGPTDASDAMGWTVTRMDHEAGKKLIVITTRCRATVYGCFDNPGLAANVLWAELQKP